MAKTDQAWFGPEDEEDTNDDWLDEEEDDDEDLDEVIDFSGEEGEDE